MERVNWRLSNKFGSHWVKVKFYQEMPKDGKKIKDIKFCQAIKLAVIHPVILDKSSINCLGAQCAFGWNNSAQKFLEKCHDKNNVSIGTLESIFSQVSCFKEPVKYIGLNTLGEPDLALAYISSEQAMNIVKTYQSNSGKSLDVSLCSMMSICSTAAVKAHLTKKVTFSFGCDESRKSAQLGRDILAVGIPRGLFEIFASNKS